MDLEAEHNALEAEKRDHAQVSVIKLLLKDIPTESYLAIIQSDCDGTKQVFDCNVVSYSMREAISKRILRLIYLAFCPTEYLKVLCKANTIKKIEKLTYEKPLKR